MNSKVSFKGTSQLAAK